MLRSILQSDFSTFSTEVVLLIRESSVFERSVMEKSDYSQWGVEDSWDGQSETESLDSNCVSPEYLFMQKRTGLVGGTEQCLPLKYSGAHLWCWLSPSATVFHPPYRDVPHVLDFWTFPGMVTPVLPCRARFPGFHGCLVKRYLWTKLFFDIGIVSSRQEFQQNTNCLFFFFLFYSYSI